MIINRLNQLYKDYDNLPVYDNVVYERVRYSWDELNSYRKKLNEHKEEFGITSAVVVKDDKIEVTVTEQTELNEEKLYDLAPKEMLTVRTQGSGLKIHENEMVEKTTDINQLISKEDFKQMAEEELSGLNAELSEFTINEAEIDIKLNFWISTDSTRKLISYIFPDAVCTQEAASYELPFYELLYRHDSKFMGDLELNEILNENLACKNCRHCLENLITECGKYAQKPDPVLEGGDCKLFEAL